MTLKVAQTAIAGNWPNNYPNLLSKLVEHVLSGKRGGEFRRQLRPRGMVAVWRLPHSLHPSEFIAIDGMWQHAKRRSGLGLSYAKNMELC